MKTYCHRLCCLTAAAMVAAALPLLANALPLMVGDKAPEFAGHDQDGHKWKLKSQLGKEVVLLYFYPKDDTRGCTAEACGLRDKMFNFKQEGVTVIGVSRDSAKSHKEFIFKYDLNFPLLADTSGDIAKAYGAQMGDNDKMDRRVSFLIGLDGRIVHITDSPDPAVHLREMQAAITRVQTKNAL
ncbi:MAG: peroxiredoxin [Limisphaerales bacterium]